MQIWSVNVNRLGGCKSILALRIQLEQKMGKTNCTNSISKHDVQKQTMLFAQLSRASLDSITKQRGDR